MYVFLAIGEFLSLAQC